MANHTFRIDGCFYNDNCFPSLNDILRWQGTNPKEYGKKKRILEYVTMSCIRRDLKGWKPDGLCRFDITWGEKNKGKKRDYDNIVSAGRKIINDAVVKTGTLFDDDPSHLLQGRDTFVYVSDPFIEVEIVEVKNDTEGVNT